MRQGMRTPLALTAALLLTSACLAEPPAAPATRPATQPATRPAGRPQALPTTPIMLGGRVFEVQVANDPLEREVGLMHVAEMPAEAGMIFVFPRAGRLGFWMKNTLIPLDIIYLDPTGRVVQTATMSPGDEAVTDSVYAAQYAVEINAGLVAELGIERGDRIFIPMDARPEHAR